MYQRLDTDPDEEQLYDLQNQINNINKRKRRQAGIFVGIVIFFLISLLFLSLYAFIHRHKKNTGNNTCKVNDYYGITNRYPDSTVYKYGINFNTTLMQPNYVYYLSPIGNDGWCKSKKKYRSDPYDIDILKNQDFMKLGYSIVSLAPDIDYGDYSLIINNVVPLLPEFNYKVWQQSDNYIRGNYPGKLVVKGCDYSFNDYIINKYNHTIFIPVGCHFTVFDLEELPNPLEQIRGDILDHGYYLHGNSTTESYEEPYWLAC